MAFPRKWERVSELTQRLMVPGGWLVRHYEFQYIYSAPIVSICFVPDPDRVWELE